LSEGELERALEEQASTGRRLGETLVELGFVSHAALSHALTEQYGIEPKSETGFGTGLRAGIERRNDRDRDRGEPQAPIADAMPLLRLVPEGEEPEPHSVEGEDLHLAQLEEQWAKLAAAEERLVDAERELSALREAARRRRDQAARLVERIRKRDRRIAELSANETKLSEPSPAGSRGHLVYAQLADRYVLVERDGDPPEPDAILELPEVGDEKLLVCRVGKSPLPNDARPCAFAQQVSESPE
jgi:hypothetical protein